MNIDTAFPSKYLKASDFEDGPRDLTITRVAVEPIGKERLMKPVVFFNDEVKGLVLNKTNALKIASIVGSKETSKWGGNTVTLFPTNVEFGGESIEAIRVRPPTTDTPF